MEKKWEEIQMKKAKQSKQFTLIQNMLSGTWIFAIDLDILYIRKSLTINEEYSKSMMALNGTKFTAPTCISAIHVKLVDKVSEEQ